MEDDRVTLLVRIRRYVDRALTVQAVRLVRLRLAKHVFPALRELRREDRRAARKLIIDVLNLCDQSLSPEDTAFLYQCDDVLAPPREERN